MSWDQPERPSGRISGYEVLCNGKVTLFFEYWTKEWTVVVYKEVSAENIVKMAELDSKHIMYSKISFMFSRYTLDPRLDVSHRPWFLKQNTDLR